MKIGIKLNITIEYVKSNATVKIAASSHHFFGMYVERCMIKNTSVAAVVAGTSDSGHV